MFENLPSIAHTELVQRISGCYENFRDVIENVVTAKSVLFFPSMVRKEKVLVQPLIVTVDYANDLMTKLLERDRMSLDSFTDFITVTYQAMRLSEIVPIPATLHKPLLEVFELIVINGMPDKMDVVNKLTKLDIGDLIVIQIEISDHVVHTGMEVIPHALGVYDSMMTMANPSTTVH